MVNRKNDLQVRKDLVLGFVISQYIHSVSPVSSAQIASDYGLDLSSATIRKISAQLERDGFLTHPHTSAGRVPTQEGYRYYVDHLMHEIQLLGEEKERIQYEYHQGVEDYVGSCFLHSLGFCFRHSCLSCEQTHPRRLAALFVEQQQLVLRLQPRHRQFVELLRADLPVAPGILAV